MDALRASPSPLERVVVLIGNQSRLAAALAVSPQAVQQWLQKGLPPERVIAVAAAVAFRITPHELCPELYPHPEDGVPPDRRESRRPSVAEVLGPFEKELREDEYNAVRVALERGGGDLFRVIRELNAPMDVRERLLKAANLGEGRAA